MRAHSGLQQKRGLSIFQIHVSDKQPAAERTPAVAWVTQRIKETPVQVEERVICQGFHQKDLLQSCTHSWGVAKSSWEACSLAVAVIHPRSAPPRSRREASLAWQKVASHGGGARWISSSHDNVGKELLAPLWAAWSRGRARPKTKITSEKSALTVKCLSVPLEKAIAQILFSALKGWCLTAEKPPFSLQELDRCWGGATGSGPWAVSLSQGVLPLILVFAVRMHSGPIFF